MKTYSLNSIGRKALELFGISEESSISFELNTQIQEKELQLQELELLQNELKSSQAKKLIAHRIRKVKREISQLEFAL